MDALETKNVTTIVLEEVSHGRHLFLLTLEVRGRPPLHFFLAAGLAGWLSREKRTNSSLVFPSHSFRFVGGFAHTSLPFNPPPSSISRPFIIVLFPHPKLREIEEKRLKQVRTTFHTLYVVQHCDPAPGSNLVFLPFSPFSSPSSNPANFPQLHPMSQQQERESDWEGKGDRDLKPI